MSTKLRRFLLTGGRAPATLELVRLLDAAGHYVIVAESLPKHLCQYSSAVKESIQLPAPRVDADAFITTLARIIIERAIDILIPTCEEIFYIAAQRERLPTTCQIWCEPLSRLESLHHKGQFIRMVESLGITIPHTVEVDSRSALEQVVQRWQYGQQVVMKPTYSRFSSKTYIQPQNVPIDNTIQPTKTETWLVQEWIEGQQFCTYSIAKGGKLLAHADYRSDFTAGTGATIAFAAAKQPDLEAQIQQILSALCLTGQFAFDWIYTTAGKWYALECNPRLTSGIHLFTPTEKIDQLFCGEIPPETIYPQSTTKSCLQLAMWSYGLISCHSAARFGDWLRTCWQSKDTLFRWNDPEPLWGQLRCLLALYRQSRKLQLSLMEVTTHDIEWNGDNK